MIGKSGLDFLDDEGKTLSDLNAEKRKQGVAENYELKLIRKDKSPLWTIVNAVPLFDKDGKFTGSLSMLIDITERKRAEEALRNAHDELEIRVRERTAELQESNEVLHAEITERKKAEETLKQSEERFKAIAETTP